MEYKHKLFHLSAGIISLPHYCCYCLVLIADACLGERKQKTLVQTDASARCFVGKSLEHG